MKLLLDIINYQDAKEIVNIFIENYSEIYNTSKEEVIKIEKENWGETFISPEKLLLSLNNPKNHIIIVKNSEIKGFCYFKEFYEGIYIEEIHVKKKYRNQGIGSKMLEFLENLAKSLNKIKLIVDAHPNAISFYLKHGFTITERKYGIYTRLEKII
jgi:ribosomal protein S18 acetylase RimI-like enzyme